MADALAKAAGRPEDPHSGPLGRLNPVIKGLGVDDRRYGQVGPQERTEVLTTADRTMRAVDRRIEPRGLAYSDTRRCRTFVSSKGVALEEWDTTYEVSGQATMRYEGQDLAEWDRIRSRTFASIGSLPFGTSLGRRLLGVTREGEGVTGEVMVMLQPRATARIFAALAEHFDYGSMDGGTVFLKPDLPPLHTHVHMVDDGTLTGGLRSRSFDDRGIRPVPLTLLREGHVAGRFLDLHRARRLDLTPTGHELDGALPPTNLMLKSGTRSMNAHMGEKGGTVVVLADLPPDMDLNVATGALQATVSGVVYTDNVPTGAVRNVTLEGDLRTVLGQVVAIASDTDRVEHVDAPGLLVKGFTIR